MKNTICDQKMIMNSFIRSRIFIDQFIPVVIIKLLVISSNNYCQSIFIKLNLVAIYDSN